MVFPVLMRGDRIKEEDNRDLFFSELKTLTCQETATYVLVPESHPYPRTGNV